MPCDSTIQTNMTDPRLVTVVAGRLNFSRVDDHPGALDLSAPSGEFISLRTRADGSLTGEVVGTSSPGLVAEFTRIYAEAGVEQWAAENGWTVAEDTETGEMVLTGYGSYE